MNDGAKEIFGRSRLLDDPRNERKAFRNMEGLIASVKTVGVIEPITVMPEGDGFRILTGHRRARAARAAGVKEVEILVRELEDELARRRKSTVSNVRREHSRRFARSAGASGRRRWIPFGSG